MRLPPVPGGVPGLERLHRAICPERQQVERPGRVDGYLTAKLIMEVLKKLAGDDFSRENVMKQARSIKGFQIPTTVPAS